MIKPNIVRCENVHDQLCTELGQADINAHTPPKDMQIDHMKTSDWPMKALIIFPSRKLGILNYDIDL